MQPQTQNNTQRPTLDLEFINAVIGATEQVITEMGQCEVTAGKPYVKKKEAPSGDVSGIVDVKSRSFTGSVSVSFPESTFKAVVSSILGIPAADIKEKDAQCTGELINIIFGAAKQRMDSKKLQFQLTLPSVIVAKGHSVEHRSDYPSIAVDFAVKNGEPFRIEICIGG